MDWLGEDQAQTSLENPREQVGQLCGGKGARARLKGSGKACVAALLTQRQSMVLN